MGAFYARCKIEDVVDRSKSVVIPKLLVDTGSEYTGVPATMLEKIGIKRKKKDVAFVMANGERVTRSVGFAIMRLDKFFTIDEVVFAEEGDLPLLGARTLEGLNLVVDPRHRKLVAAGPLPAAVSGMNDKNFLLRSQPPRTQICRRPSLPARLEKPHAAMRGNRLAPIQYLSGESIR